MNERPNTPTTPPRIMSDIEVCLLGVFLDTVEYREEVRDIKGQ